MWKNKYVEADRKNEELPMIEINLKNASQTIVKKQYKYQHYRLIQKIE